MSDQPEHAPQDDDAAPSHDEQDGSREDHGAPEHDEVPQREQDAGPATVTAGDAADPRIAAAVARLDGLGDTPPAEHVEVYEDVHRALQDALADAARGDGSGSDGSAAQGHPGGSRQ